MKDLLIAAVYTAGVVAMAAVIAYAITDTKNGPTQACKLQAAAAGAGEFYMDRKTGKTEWKWTPASNSAYFTTLTAP